MMEENSEGGCILNSVGDLQERVKWPYPEESQEVEIDDKQKSLITAAGGSGCQGDVCSTPLQDCIEKANGDRGGEMPVNLTLVTTNPVGILCQSQDEKSESACQASLTTHNADVASFQPDATIVECVSNFAPGVSETSEGSTLVEAICLKCSDHCKCKGDNEYTYTSNINETSCSSSSCLRLPQKDIIHQPDSSTMPSSRDPGRNFQEGVCEKSIVDDCGELRQVLTVEKGEAMKHRDEKLADPNPLQGVEATDTIHGISDPDSGCKDDSKRPASEDEALPDKMCASEVPRDSNAHSCQSPSIGIRVNVGINSVVNQLGSCDHPVDDTCRILNAAVSQTRDTRMCPYRVTEQESHTNEQIDEDRGIRIYQSKYQDEVENEYTTENVQACDVQTSTLVSPEGVRFQAGNKEPKVDSKSSDHSAAEATSQSCCELPESVQLSDTNAACDDIIKRDEIAQMPKEMNSMLHCENKIDEQLDARTETHQPCDNVPNDEVDKIHSGQSDETYGEELHIGTTLSQCFNTDNAIEQTNKTVPMQNKISSMSSCESTEKENVLVEFKMEINETDKPCDEPQNDEVDKVDSSQCDEEIIEMVNTESSSSHCLSTCDINEQTDRNAQLEKETSSMLFFDKPEKENMELELRTEIDGLSNRGQDVEADKGDSGQCDKEQLETVHTDVIVSHCLHTVDVNEHSHKTVQMQKDMNSMLLCDSPEESGQVEFRIETDTTFNRVQNEESDKLDSGRCDKEQDTTANTDVTVPQLSNTGKVIEQLGETIQRLHEINSMLPCDSTENENLQVEVHMETDHLCNKTKNYGTDRLNAGQCQTHVENLCSESTRSQSSSSDDIGEQVDKTIQLQKESNSTSPSGSAVKENMEGVFQEEPDQNCSTASSDEADEMGLIQRHKMHNQTAQKEINYLLSCGSTKKENLQVEYKMEENQRCDEGENEVDKVHPGHSCEKMFKESPELQSVSTGDITEEVGKTSQMQQEMNACDFTEKENLQVELEMETDQPCKENELERAQVSQSSETMHIQISPLQSVDTVDAKEQTDQTEDMQKGVSLSITSEDSTEKKNLRGEFQIETDQPCDENEADKEQANQSNEGMHLDISLLQSVNAADSMEQTSESVHMQKEVKSMSSDDSAERKNLPAEFQIETDQPCDENEAEREQASQSNGGMHVDISMEQTSESVHMQKEVKSMSSDDSTERKNLLAEFQIETDQPCDENEAEREQTSQSNGGMHVEISLLQSVIAADSMEQTSESVQMEKEVKSMSSDDSTERPNVQGTFQIERDQPCDQTQNDEADDVHSHQREEKQFQKLHVECTGDVTEQQDKTVQMQETINSLALCGSTEKGNMQGEVLEEMEQPGVDSQNDEVDKVNLGQCNKDGQVERLKTNTEMDPEPTCGEMVQESRAMRIKMDSGAERENHVVEENCEVRATLRANIELKHEDRMCTVVRFADGTCKYIKNEPMSDSEEVFYCTNPGGNSEEMDTDSDKDFINTPKSLKVEEPFEPAVVQEYESHQTPESEDQAEASPSVTDSEERLGSVAQDRRLRTLISTHPSQEDAVSSCEYDSEGWQIGSDDEREQDTASTVQTAANQEYMTSCQNKLCTPIRCPECMKLTCNCKMEEHKLICTPSTDQSSGVADATCTCPECGVGFYKGEDLTIHLSIHKMLANSAQKMEERHEVEKVTSTLPDATEAGTTESQCSICMQTFRDATLGPYHEMMHKTHTIHCSRCNMFFKSLLELRHQRCYGKKHHKAFKYRCVLCNAIKVDSHKMLRHRAACDGYTEICRRCRQKFKTFMDLAHHAEVCNKRATNDSEISKVEQEATGLSDKGSEEVCRATVSESEGFSNAVTVHTEKTKKTSVQHVGANLQDSKETLTAITCKNCGRDFHRNLQNGAHGSGTSKWCTDCVAKTADIMKEFMSKKRKLSSSSESEKPRLDSSNEVIPVNLSDHAKKKQKKECDLMCQACGHVFNSFRSLCKHAAKCQAVDHKEQLIESSESQRTVPCRETSQRENNSVLQHKCSGCQWIFRSARKLRKHSKTCQVVTKKSSVQNPSLNLSFVNPLKQYVAGEIVEEQKSLPPCPKSLKAEASLYSSSTMTPQHEVSSGDLENQHSDCLLTEGPHAVSSKDNPMVKNSGDACDERGETSTDSQGMKMKLKLQQADAKNSRSWSVLDVVEQAIRREITSSTTDDLFIRAAKKAREMNEINVKEESATPGSSKQNLTICSKKSNEHEQSPFRPIEASQSQNVECSVLDNAILKETTECLDESLSLSALPVKLNSNAAQMYPTSKISSCVSLGNSMPPDSVGSESVKALSLATRQVLKAETPTKVDCQGGVIGSSPVKQVLSAGESSVPSRQTVVEEQENVHTRQGKSRLTDVPGFAGRRHAKPVSNEIPTLHIESAQTNPVARHKGIDLQVPVSAVRVVATPAYKSGNSVSAEGTSSRGLSHFCVYCSGAFPSREELWTHAASCRVTHLVNITSQVAGNPVFDGSSMQNSANPAPFTVLDKNCQSQRTQLYNEIGVDLSQVNHVGSRKEAEKKFVRKPLTVKVKKKKRKKNKKKKKIKKKSKSASSLQKLHALAKRRKIETKDNWCFKCELCNKKFGLRYKFEIHKRRHVSMDKQKRLEVHVKQLSKREIQEYTEGGNEVKNGPPGENKKAERPAERRQLSTKSSKSSNSIVQGLLLSRPQSTETSFTENACQVLERQEKVATSDASNTDHCNAISAVQLLKEKDGDPAENTSDSIAAFEPKRKKLKSEFAVTYPPVIDVLCGVCGQTFSHQSTLERHAKLHSSS